MTSCPCWRTSWLNVTCLSWIRRLSTWWSCWTHLCCRERVGSVSGLWGQFECLIRWSRCWAVIFVTGRGWAELIENWLNSETLIAVVISPFCSHIVTALSPWFYRWVLSDQCLWSYGSHQEHSGGAGSQGAELPGKEHSAPVAPATHRPAFGAVREWLSGIAPDLNAPWASRQWVWANPNLHTFKPNDETHERKTSNREEFF